MNRLSLYLVRLFSREALALLGIMLGLLFLVQCLKIFDVVVVQGQNILTLVGQVALSMPPLAIVIAYVCMGIGIVRGFSALQGSQELHILHASRQLKAIFSGVATFAIGGAVIVLFLSNIVQPWSSHRLNDWVASVAADIVGRTLTPHRVSQVVPGITIFIGGRQGTGNISEFFADDRRDPEMRRTYSAKTARIAADADKNYVLELHDGTLQYLSDKGDFSEISFKTYNIGLNKLTEQVENHDNLAETTSWELVQAGLASGQWPADVVHRLLERMAEGLRTISMCVFMAALMAFPNARRRRPRFPRELLPLIVAYADKTISGFSGDSNWGLYAGPLTVLIVGLVILIVRLRVIPLPAWPMRQAA